MAAPEHDLGDSAGHREFVPDRLGRYEGIETLDPEIASRGS
jgi:hypothetical protein